MRTAAHWKVARRRLSSFRETEIEWESTPDCRTNLNPSLGQSNEKLGSIGPSSVAIDVEALVIASKW